MRRHKVIWITWEHQRRSIELSRYFKCRLFIIEYAGILRYPLCLMKTLSILLYHNPSIVFIQNPSMILASFACIYGKITKKIIIVDRHSTFLLNRTKKDNFRIKIFRLFSKLTIRLATITIVTNNYLASIVLSLKGNPVVIPDKLPSLKQSKTIELKASTNIVLISSFGKDEPISEALQAMGVVIHKDVHLYITGNYKKLDPSIYNAAPENVTFTGFLSEENYQNLLFSCDIAMALTKSEHCMLCGCYEAIAASKPLITSSSNDLINYFRDAVFVNNSPESIANGITTIMESMTYHKETILRRKYLIEKSWPDYALPIRDLIEVSGPS